MSPCQHCDIVIFVLLNTLIKVTDEFITLKKQIKSDFSELKLDAQVDKKADLGEKHPAVGALVTCVKTPTTVIWSERLMIYCRVIVTQ